MIPPWRDGGERRRTWEVGGAEAPGPLDQGRRDTRLRATRPRLTRQPPSGASPPRRTRDPHARTRDPHARTGRRHRPGPATPPARGSAAAPPPLPASVRQPSTHPPRNDQEDRPVPSPAAKSGSDGELEQPRGFPELTVRRLIRYFMLTADEMCVRKFRGQGNLLGATVQFCTPVVVGVRARRSGLAASGPPWVVGYEGVRTITEVGSLRRSAQAQRCPRQRHLGRMVRRVDPRDVPISLGRIGGSWRRWPFGC
jgi:hypothetical protein